MHGQTVTERVSVIRLEVHNLERLKQTCGQAAVDERLEQVAEAAGELPGASAYSVGEGRFLVELHGTGAWEALELVQELQSDFLSAEPPVFLAAGVAEAEAGENVSAVLDRSDAALITAKVSRRGAVVYSHGAIAGP
jgi:predicted signal transduction protein with EAL and GGDEF domain